MPDFDSKKRRVRRELEKMGYQNISETQLDEFTTDLQRLICHDRASRGSRSHARSQTATSPSSRGGDRCRDDCRRPRPCSSRYSSNWPPAEPCGGQRPGRLASKLVAGSSRQQQRLEASRSERARSPALDGCESLYSEGDSEFRDLPAEMLSDGTRDDCNFCEEVCDDDCAPCPPDDCGQRAMCARPFPKLRVAPMVPPEMMCPRGLARPGFRVNCDMLAHPIRSDPCTRMKWYRDYWSTLKIPGIYKHYELCTAVRNMLDTYDYIPRPLNRREPVWNMSLLREQPTAIMRLNWC